MEFFNVLKKPIITEKSQQLELTGVYTMEISSQATKVDVKNAFYKLYGVAVDSVNIIKTQKKFKQSRAGITTKRKSSVKALIKLKKGQKFSDLQKIKIKD